MEAGALRAPAALNRITVTVPLLRMRSDEQLVALFRAGNEAAFGVIHDRYRQRLFAYARQMLAGSRQDAEDALQDVFMRAYASLRSNDRPLSLRAWLYRVAHNRCIDHLRKPVPQPIDLFDTSRRPLHDPITESERREDLQQLIADVQRLPEQQRSALLMREIDGLTYAELSEALGVTLPAVKSLLVRARIGLVEAHEARDTACTEIRLDLVASFDRGVRASGLARRHLRDCPSCVEYRAQLRGVSKGLNSLQPGAPGLVSGAMKLLGLGGAGSAGAASAGGGAAAGSGALVAASGGTVAKVAAVVCCAALTAGGAAEVKHVMTKPKSSATRSAHGSAQSAALRAWAHTPATERHNSRAVVERKRAAAAAERRRVTAPEGAGAGAPIVATGDDPTTGGATAPDEEEVLGHGPDGLQPLPEDAATGSLATEPAAAGGDTAPGEDAGGGAPGGGSAHTPPG